MTRKLKKLYQDLRDLKIQGATAVAQAIAENLGPYIKWTEKKEDYQEVKEIADYLLSARPTEAMARNGVYFVLNALRGEDPQEIEKLILKKSQEFGRLEAQVDKQLSQAGLKIFPKVKTVFTHCHSSSVEEILTRAKKKGFQFQVINTETRPLFQGRITAAHLLKAGIPVTMIVDSAGTFFLSSEFPQKIDFLILGADAVLEDGSVMNKIGSYGLSLVAKENHIPVYIAASLLKYYPGSKIEIEERPREEIWSHSPRKLKITNLAFDRVPVKHIKAFITEAGVISPKHFAQEAFKFYPWLYENSI